MSQLITSLRLNNDLSVDEFVDLARLAESLHFDQIWVSNDLFFRSAPVLLAAAATATRDITLGTCVLNPYSVHPAEIAMTAATHAGAQRGPLHPRTGGWRRRLPRLGRASPARLRWPARGRP